MGEDFEPKSNELYQCSESSCEVIFAHLDEMVVAGFTIYACPKCWGIDFIVIPKAAIRSLFHHIIEHDFSLVRRNNLRMIAEDRMAPFDPADRDR
jgi:hypothetical protein